MNGSAKKPKSQPNAEHHGRTLKPWDYHKLICETRGIGKAERLVLFGMMKWVAKDGELWPAVDSIADAAGLTRRGCQTALRTLEERGILSIVAGHRGGRTANHHGIATKRRINADKLIELGRKEEGQTEADDGEADLRPSSSGDQLDPAGKGAPHDEQGRISRQARAHGATGKGASGAPKPSIQHPENNQKNHVEGDLSFAGMHGMEREQNLREVLIRYGIKGQNLDRLATHPRLDVATVIAEGDRINTDAGVRNKGGALTTLLARILEIEIGRRKRLHIMTDVHSVIAKIDTTTAAMYSDEDERLTKLRANRT